MPADAARASLHGMTDRESRLFAVAAGIFAVTVLTLAPSARAADPVAQGRALAEENCAGCHAIAGPGPGPVAEAPPFSGFARKWPLEDLAEAFAEGIMVGHPTVAMPEFVFSAAEIEALLAYLGSVQE
jgi:mono/diheme cytochrome c family protein